MARGLTIKRKRGIGLKQAAMLALAAVLLVGAGWLGYRWYFFGDDLPVPIAQAKADPRVDESPVNREQIDHHNVEKLQPRYISIPKLGIGNTRVFKTGLDANGRLGVPKNISDTSWYENSATPGSGYGAVLIDGHNGGISRNGVFAGLKSLLPGDEIVVERGDGQTFRYRVVENQSMPLDKVNKTGMSKMMKSADEDKEGLNLITCDGKWVPRYQQFDRRIMLRAVRVDS